MRTSAPGQSALLLLDAVDVLEAGRFDYAVIGAMAGSVHGAVRASLDADAVVSTTISQARALMPVLVAAGFKTEFRSGDPDDPIAAVLVLADEHGNWIDLLIGLRGMEPAAFKRSIAVEFHGTTLRIIGREDFVAMKVHAGRPTDLLDARAVLDLERDSLDLGLLRRLADSYGRHARKSLDELLQ